MSRLLFLWGPVAAQMAVIFGASSLPNLTRLPGDVPDHVGHFAGYALLSALAVRAFSGGRWAGVTSRAAVWAWSLCLFYGATDELHQGLVAGRSPALDDWIADALGAAAAATLLVAIGAAIARRREGREV